jgi:hypothetical protein
VQPTKVLPTKDSLPDGIIHPPAAEAPYLNMTRPSAKTTIPLTQAFCQFTNSCYAFLLQEWFDLARDILRWRKTTPSAFGWYVGRGPHGGEDDAVVIGVVTPRGL